MTGIRAWCAAERPDSIAHEDLVPDDATLAAIHEERLTVLEIYRYVYNRTAISRNSGSIFHNICGSDSFVVREGLPRISGDEEAT